MAREAIERLLVELEDLEAGGIRGISASVGIAALAMGDKPESVLAAARAALDQARARGGRQAVAFGGSSENGDAALDPGHGDVIAALASALEERDRYTGEHSESVVDLTARVGEALALGGEEISRVRTAALLHDIGKVGVPDEILHKPGPLNDQEWEIMRQHPAIGERILRAIPGMGDVARIVRHEHERWDGKGYPDGSPARDPGRQPDHPRLRRLPRDGLRPSLPQGDGAHRRDCGVERQRRHPVRPGRRARR